MIKIHLWNKKQICLRAHLRCNINEYLILNGEARANCLLSTFMYIPVCETWYSLLQVTQEYFSSADLYIAPEQHTGVHIR